MASSHDSHIAATPRPTDSELAILNVLWRSGPATVREIHGVLAGERGEDAVGYTTILKLLQIMTEKRLVQRDESSRSHIYHAKLPREETQKQLVRELLERAFAGSARQLVLQALSTQTASAEDLAEIQQLIDSMKRPSTPKRKGTTR